MTKAKETNIVIFRYCFYLILFFLIFRSFLSGVLLVTVLFLVLMLIYYFENNEVKWVNKKKNNKKKFKYEELEGRYNESNISFDSKIKVRKEKTFFRKVDKSYLWLGRIDVNITFIILGLLAIYILTAVFLGEMPFKVILYFIFILMIFMPLLIFQRNFYNPNAEGPLEFYSRYFKEQKNMKKRFRK